MHNNVCVFFFGFYVPPVSPLQSSQGIVKMMEHSSIASTQIYAQITDQKITRDMDRLIQLINM